MKKRKKYLLLFILFCVCFYFIYHKFERNRTLHNDQKIVELVLKDSFQEQSILKKISEIHIPWEQGITLLRNDSVPTVSIQQEAQPLIYLYNSHPGEEYASSTIGEYMLEPTVIMNNYLLEGLWKNAGYVTYVEEKSVRDILNENNWNYASSYRASRILLEERKQEYPSLTFFIDIHRDSLEKDRTTIQIGDKSYAQVLFIVGMENENYQENLKFTERIVEKLDAKYPSLCKGIYKKAGAGVNGVYNQDFSPRTILIEVGGYENTTIEVMNTSIAFSQCFLEVLHEEGY